MLDKCLGFFNSLTKSMDVIYVIKGLKKVSRIIAKSTELEETRKFLDKLGLITVVSDYKVNVEFDNDGFSNKGLVSLDPEGGNEGSFLLYVAKDEEDAKSAKEYESKGKHLELGKILGYPSCCCEFFEKNFPHESKHKNDYVLASLRNSGGFIFPFYNNVAIKNMDLNLLSHFPCRLDCKESVDIAKKNLELLNELSPQLGGISEGMLKGAVIYTDNQGIFLLRDSKVEGNFISYEGVMAPSNEKIYCDLKDNEKIQVINNNHIKIGETELKGEDIGIMFFD